MASLSYDEIANTIGLDPMHEIWRSTFHQSEPLLDDADPLPQGRTLEDLCRALRVPSPAIAPLVDGAVQFESDPILRRLLAHGRWMLRDELPRVGAWLVPWGRLPASLGPVGDLFHPLVFLADAARIRRWHHENGITDDVSIDTLSDLGVHLSHYHRMFGHWGLEEPQWLGLHFTGRLYRLGRLQFELGKWGVPVADPAACPLERDDPILDVHIAEIGPLDSDACDESVEHARAFFPRTFPDVPFKAFGCWSWLLDPNLRTYLPERSNILRFQNRFHAVPTAQRHDGQALKFVFRLPPETKLEAYPGRTVLERAVVDHVRAGGTWSACLGYFR